MKLFDIHLCLLCLLKTQQSLKMIKFRLCFRKKSKNFLFYFSYMENTALKELGNLCLCRFGYLMNFMRYLNLSTLPPKKISNYHFSEFLNGVLQEIIMKISFFQHSDQMILHFVVFIHVWTEFAKSIFGTYYYVVANMVLLRKALKLLKH